MFILKYLPPKAPTITETTKETRVTTCADVHQTRTRAKVNKAEKVKVKIQKKMKREKNTDKYT